MRVHEHIQRQLSPWAVDFKLCTC